MTGSIKGRFLLLWFVCATIASVIASVAFSLDDLEDVDWPGYWGDVPALYVFYGLLLMLTAVHGLFARVDTRRMFGNFPETRAARRVAMVTVPLIGAALVTTYVVFAPLSLLWPDAVDMWLFEGEPVIYQDKSPYPLLSNFLGVTLIALWGPVFEEWFFRGLLLRRWSQKWGAVRGVVVSSLVFALLHSDVVGAFMFGVAMCGLYSRYGSLWAPTIVHVANNTIAVLFIIIEAHASEASIASAADLRAAWWMPVIGLLLFVPALPRLRRHWTPISSWRFDGAARLA